MRPVFEQINVGEDRSIIAFRYSKNHFDAPWHFHPQHELTYIQSSVGTKFIGDYVGSYGPGELVLLRSNLPHCWKNQLDPSCKAESVVIQWNVGIFSEVPELRSMFGLLKVASKGIIFSKEATKSLIPSIERLCTLDDYQLYIELLSLLVELTHCPFKTLSKASFIDDLPATYSDRMSEIHDFVELHFHRKIYLKEVASMSHLSEQAFSRFFSHVMGRPFFSFLNEYRINVARRMLIDTDISVAQIGYACGFESLTFFHKQFKNFNQMSPLKYRKQYQLKQ